MWGFVKSNVYVTSISELKGRTRAAFAEIAVEMRKKIALVYRERLGKVIKNHWEGGARRGAQLNWK